MLRDLIDIRAVLRAAMLDVPAALTQAIERDGADAAVFPPRRPPASRCSTDAVEEDGVIVDLVLTRSETPRPRADAGAACRVSAACRPGRAWLLVDTGKPPPPGFDGEAHAGMLSFELSQGRERIIVNCGGYRGAKPAWRRVARASAAHSVLVVGDTNAVEILADGSLGRGPGTGDLRARRGGRPPMDRGGA